MNERARELLESVPSMPSFPAEEEHVLSFWEQERVFERSVAQRPDNDRFVFYEGPPTANGMPGLHHVIARAFKDAVPRYQTMRGKRVERRAGWDTHGLPVELQVEKQLGISGKRDIENIVPNDVQASIAKFNQLCRESVWQYKDEWERLTKRMGFWLDLDHPYITYENEYIESLWWILSELWQRQLLYEDFKVVPFCPRCGTALSSHEVAQGYRDTTDRSVYIKFSVLDEEKTYLIAWTTTPWTLPGNVALAVNTNLSYGRYKNFDTGETYILADDRVRAVFGDINYEREDISKDELLALRYRPLFEIPELNTDLSHRVYAAPFVTAEDGSGVVHTAVMYGVDDFSLGESIGLPKVHTVTQEGRFTDDVPIFAGKFVKDPDVENDIISFLNEGGYLLREEQYAHNYPFCWRCDTPLIYYAKGSWFIKMSALRNELLAENNTITWVPDHLRDGRFGEWLREVKDWALSRDRYWGTPLPVWACDKCSHKECFGGRTALEARGATVPADLHRPYIDAVTFACTACNAGTMRRYTEVIDVWFDSGAMPLAQWHYPAAVNSDKAVDEHFPADYISEGIDQTRGWFYTLLAISTALGRGTPYKAVVSMAHILDKHGKKMSKSRGNAVDPWALIDEYGVDPLRFYFYSVNQPGDSKRFDPADISQVVRKHFLIVWNTYNFVAGRAKEEGWKPDSSLVPGKEHPLDSWLVARTHLLVRTVTGALDELDLFRASRAIGEYATELSTWYLRLSRKRTDDAFMPTLFWALKMLVVISAPLTPFFAEALWQRLRFDDDPVSVHLATWPETYNSNSADVLEMMTKVQNLVELGRAARAEAGIKLRQPLASATISGVLLQPAHQEILAAELNVKSVVLKSGTTLALSLDTVITNELRTEGQLRDVIRAIQSLRKTAKLALADKAQIEISGSSELLNLLRPFANKIEVVTLAEISWDSVTESTYVTELDGLRVALIA